MLSLFSPRLLWVRQHDGPQFPIAIAAATGQDCILLDPQAGKVARHFASTPISLEQVALRERWAQHVSSPPFQVCEKGHVLLEEYIEGRRIENLDADAQTVACRELYRSYASLTRAEGEGSCRTLLEPLDHQVLSQLRPSLRRQLKRGLSLARSATWPLVPAPRTRRWANVIVVDGRVPVCIDCFPLRQVPFFYHPMFLTFDNDHSRAAYRRGVFDADVAGLLAAADVEFHPITGGREVLMALTVATYDLGETRRAMRTGVFDGMEFVKSANRLWDKWAAAGASVA